MLTNCVRWTCKTYFLATEVLAKHDENYMSPEIAEAIKKAEAEAKAIAATEEGH